MFKCPYCGHTRRDGDLCERCRAYVPAEKPKDQPKKAEKKPDKE